MVDGLFLDDYDLRINSYNMIKHEITTSTSTMTSIPRPLKFIRLNFAKIKEFYDKKHNLDDEMDKLKYIVKEYNKEHKKVKETYVKKKKNK